MRAHDIHTGSYYRIHLPDNTQVTGKVLEVVERRDENANHRYRCEITEGERRGEEVEVTSRRVHALPETNGRQARPTPRVIGNVVSGTMRITMGLTIPVADLPDLMALLAEYRPHIVGAESVQ